MNRCITPISSTTAKWLAATNRLYSTFTSTLHPSPRDAVERTTALDHLSRWKPLTAPLLPTHAQGTSSLVETVAITAEQNDEASKVSPEPVQQELPTTTNEPNPLPIAPPINSVAIAAKDNERSPRTAAYERRPLPLSPLMDPAAIAAKQKHHAPKPLPSKNPEPFQRILSKNPYALALATPLRRCQLTQVSLPSFFLQDFSLMAHPETRKPWYVPRSLTNKYVPTRLQKQAELGWEAGEELEMKGERQSNSQSERIGGGYTPKIGYSTYTLSSKFALRAMKESRGYAKKLSSRYIKEAVQRGMPATGITAHAFQFIQDRYRQARAAFKVVITAGWRNDMDELVLDLMRRRTFEDLVHVTELKRGYVVGCKGWEDGMAKPQVGAFLWTGGNGDIEMDFPPEFATLDINTKVDKTRKVPVHNLRTLLGKGKLAELREKFPTGIFENEVVVLKHKKTTVNLEMRLWKLQGYLAEHRAFSEDVEEEEVGDFEGEDNDLENSESSEKEED
jgi:hypothetical protein